tara:strand:- start:33 stop:1055 length:1023 start_codon:yes stop_codon:yes gene_type:complete
MSCGLGAVILMFLLVKKNSQEDIIETSIPQNNLEIELLKKEERSLLAENTNLINLKAKLTNQEEELKINTKDYENILFLQKEKEKENNFEIKELEKKLKEISIKKDENKLYLKGEGQQEYLIGLEIKGKKIGILLDSSSSMTDEKLIDIIKRKTQSDENIKKGPKWQRTIRIVKWLFARLPNDSKVTVVKFSNNSKILGEKNWYDNNSKDLSLLNKEVNRVIPKNSTNLHAAFKAISQMNDKPDEIFLITDGLPTIGHKSTNTSFFSNCNSIVGNAKKISGNCREKLFLSSINDAKSIISNIKINVILLPLEGDPGASKNFWKLAARNQGLLLVPSKDWP